MANTTYGLIAFDGIWDWDPQTTPQQVKELYRTVLALVDDKIRWYHRWRRSRGRLAKTIRVIAVMLMAFSTLMPYGAAVDPKNATVYLSVGYCLVGLGAGLLLIDRFYGLSNSWVRFVLTGMDLENMRNAFVEHWQILFVNSLPLTKKSFGNLVNALLAFQESFHGVVKAETETWAREFQQNMKDLVAALKLQSEDLKNSLEKTRQATLQKATDVADGESENVPFSAIREAMDRKFDEWNQVFKIVAVSSGKKMVDGKRTETNCLVFTPVDKLKAGEQLFIPIPPVIHYQSIDGHRYDIPTDVRPGGSKIKAATDPALLCDAQVPKRPGCSISRDSSDAAGTLGLKVFKDGKTFLLSCYHVLCEPEMGLGRLQFFATQSAGSTDIISPAKRDSSNSQSVAQVVDGELSVEKGLDCAIAQIVDQALVTGNICSIDASPGLPVDVSEADEGKLSLICVGRTSGILTGIVENAISHCVIEYTINGASKVLRMDGLISTNLRIQPGDSGAIVLDRDTNNVVGMVVAGSDNFSHLIPINRILSRFSVTLK